jgi:hypothetical protein
VTTNTDALTLVTLTAAFALFAATMAWAETLTRRYTAVRAPVATSSQYK